MTIIAPAPTTAPSPSSSAAPREAGAVLRAMRRGLQRRCPSCGGGRLFRGYVKQEPVCTGCGEDLLQFRADDAPAYFTILLVGHVIVPAMLMLEVARHPSTLVHTLLWVPLTLLMTFLLLPLVKGALIGVQWAFGVKN
jgi:uncharacterized protein (DUF983 family)